jgi:excisionase family DNA binding protein
MEIQQKRFYRIDEIARILDLTNRTIYRWAERGLIRFIRLGGHTRISAEEFQRVLSEGMKKKY